jgi:phosphoglycerate dehydrogenase-like enzyme
MSLHTFAFIHPLAAERLQAFRDALPDVEFLLPDDSGLPAGLERAEAAAISWDSPPIDTILAAAPRLRWLHQRGAGIDRIATPRLVASDVVVTNGSGNHAPNIAEHVLALMLAFARGLPGLIRAQQQRRWQSPAAHDVFELSGQTLALVGVGAIGSAIAQRASALGMEVVGVRRSAAGTASAGIARVVGIDALDSVLAVADHVAVSLPLTAATRGLFSTERLAAMKRGAYLYNVGRGATVDPAALLDALRSGRLAGAGLDVTEPEPLPAESALWAEPGVIVTAHSSGLTPRSFERYQRLLLDNLLRFARGEPLLNLVDKRLGY